MELKLNSYVLYGDNGVCTVADKRKEKFAGQIHEYFILRPVNNMDLTLFVPADNEEILSKMRPVLSKDEVIEVVRSLKGESMEWIEDNKARGEAYKEIFERADRRELLLLLKSLNEHKKLRKADGKKLWTIDENAMKHAESLVLVEIAAVLGIPNDQVVPFILSETSGE